MHAIAHGGCTDTVRVCTGSRLWEKNPLAHWELDLTSALSPALLTTLTPYLKSFIFTSYFSSTTSSKHHNPVLLQHLIVRIRHPEEEERDFLILSSSRVCRLRPQGFSGWVVSTLVGFEPLPAWGEDSSSTGMMNRLSVVPPAFTSYSPSCFTLTTHL